MSILIGADLVPTKSNIGLFAAGDIYSLLGNDLVNILSNADYRIFNLEVPIVDQENRILKMGPNLIAPTECLKGLKQIGVNLFTLANNHILDQGEQGLKSTIELLNNVGIDYVGVGEDVVTAAKPFYFRNRNKLYGVYACAEHEFSIADQLHSGANPFDPLETPDHLALMTSQCDYIIVLYHGGKEHYRYPSPNLQKTCRKMIDKGANLVVCQHSHCIGCKEEYNGGTIVYGQGNFLFDDSEDELWKTSILIRITDNGEIEYIPLKKEKNTVRLASEETGRRILEQFIKRSTEIKDPSLVKKKYDEFAQESISSYLLFFSGKRNSFTFRVANKLSGHRLQEKVIRKYASKQALGIRNYVDCEAHRELLVHGLIQTLYDSTQ